MTLKLRQDNGVNPLTEAEIDGNFLHLAQAIETKADAESTLAALNEKTTPAETAAQISAATSQLIAQRNVWEKAQSSPYTALTSTAGVIAVDLDHATFELDMTENSTLDEPINAVAGQDVFIHITNHASAPKTLSFNAFWKFPTGAEKSLTPLENAVDALSCKVAPSGGYAICTLGRGIA